MKRLFSTALSALSLVAVASPSFAQDIVALKSHSTKIDYLNQIRVEQKVNHNNTINRNTPTKINKEAVSVKSTPSAKRRSFSTKIDYLNQLRLDQRVNHSTQSQVK